MIEFNEIAKPKMAVGFDGTLVLSHWYKTKGNSFVQLVETKDHGWPHGLLMLGDVYNSMGEKTAVAWYNLKGLYTGFEHMEGHAMHIAKEWPEPPKFLTTVADTGLMLKAGEHYINGIGTKTTPMELHMVHHGAVGGPIYKCKFILGDGDLTPYRWFNVKGLYLGSGTVTYPTGHPTSLKNLKKVAQ